MRRLRVRQLLECATRDLAVRVDRQRTFQALTPPFRSLGDGRHPQPGGFVAWIDAQRLGEERSSPRFVAGANGGDSVDNDAMDVGRNGVRHWRLQCWMICSTALQQRTAETPGAQRVKKMDAWQSIRARDAIRKPPLRMLRCGEIPLLQWTHVLLQFTQMIPGIVDEKVIDLIAKMQQSRY